MDDGRSMRAVETVPATSLNAGEDEELSPGLVWLVPSVSHHRPWTCAVSVHAVTVIYRLTQAKQGDVWLQDPTPPLLSLRSCGSAL